MSPTHLLHVVLILAVLLLLKSGVSQTRTIPGVASNGTLTLGYLLSWSHEWAAGPYIGSSIVVAIKEIERRQLLPGYNIGWILEDTWCQAGQGLKAAIEVWFKANDLDAVIGGGCSVVCEPVSLLAAAWNIPVVSYGCVSDRLSNKKTFSTFTRTVGPYYQVNHITHAFVDIFQWNCLGIISDKVDIYFLTAQKLEIMLKDAGKQTYLYLVEPTTAGTDVEVTLENLRKVLRLIQTSCRIIYIAMYPLDTRDVLAMAYDEDMLEGFVFIGSEAEPPLGVSSHFRPDLGLEIYEGAIDLEVSVPEGPEWDDFRQEVIDSFQSPEFDGWEHIGPNASVDTVNIYSGMIHDSVLLWAHGVNKSLQQGYAPDDGMMILKSMVNTTFKGITGQVTIDENGDRLSDYIVRMFQNGTMVPILYYMANLQKFIKLYEPDQPDNWVGLIWPGNTLEIPRDRPICGWKSQLCFESNQSRVRLIMAVCFVLLLLLMVALVGVCILRRRRFERSLKDAISCLVSWSEVEEMTFCDAKALHTSVLTLKSSDSDNIEQQFCPIVRLKSEIVAVKSLGSSRININDRQVLLELKAMKELHHDNLNPFMGICIETVHSSVFMKYASRGSLQDIIASDKVVLTWDFKLSLAMDVARGMNAIHSGVPGWHGHLTTSNCVVDSRWVCKITDYGLHHIKYGTPPGGSKEHSAPDFLLWTAPELLNQNSVIPGSKKADVYSYGIIIQEIVLQSCPYSDNDDDLLAEEIVQKVKARSSPPYRPFIPPGSCDHKWSDLMSSCWQDVPDGRPTFSQILSMLRNINGGRESKLIDSMIQRLEMHSTQLENTVDKRSLELMEEKDKVESLLQELLPKSIADNLKLGKRVLPESFDCVTIFFSDLVGFTRISAAGTPLDVVRMLNLMYTVFDHIATEYDVYKVATIGDAYFVASGVPNRNGNKHASEISNMAIKLLEAVSNLPIPHLPDEALKLRIGIHTGPCLAGVVGTKMPRYLLFGDTIDIASQMESKGEIMKIHVTQTTVSILPSNCYQLLLREEPIDIKGQGKMVTYWLES